MTYRLPSLNTLRAFEAAARHLSFKVAASELGVTAGAVSQQVKKLETSLGLPLFRRLPHGLLLTEEGEIYLPKISKVFDDITDATEKIAPKINSKKFTIGICKKTKGVLPEKWPSYNENLKPYIRDSKQTSDIELIRTGEIDCLIRLGGGSYNNLTCKSIQIHPSKSKQSNELHFVCKPALAECRQSKMIIENLTQYLTSSN